MRNQSRPCYYGGSVKMLTQGANNRVERIKITTKSKIKMGRLVQRVMSVWKENGDFLEGVSDNPRLSIMHSQLSKFFVGLRRATWRWLVVALSLFLRSAAIALGTPPEL